jgi:hypothetical protein
MARELRDDEICGMNTFLGVHVWEFQQKTANGEVFTSVACRKCTVEPKYERRIALIADFERTVEAQKQSTKLKLMHKEATGLGKRRA